MFNLSSEAKLHFLDLFQIAYYICIYVYNMFDIDNLGNVLDKYQTNIRKKNIRSIRGEANVVTLNIGTCQTTWTSEQMIRPCWTWCIYLVADASWNLHSCCIRQKLIYHFAGSSAKTRVGKLVENIWVVNYSSYVYPHLDIFGCAAACWVLICSRAVLAFISVSGTSCKCLQLYWH